MRPLRILYIAQHYLPEVGALPARASEMAYRWVERGAEVTVLCSVPHRPEGLVRPEYRGTAFSAKREHGVEVLRSAVLNRPGHSFAWNVAAQASFAILGTLQAFMRDRPWDVIIASEPPFFPHLSGSLLGMIQATPVVLEIRDLWPDYLEEMGVLPSPVQKMLFAAESAVLCRAEHVVTVTESFRQRVIRKGVRPSSASVISNGVDTGFYFPGQAAPPCEALRRRSASEQIVGYLGNFGRGQGLEQVIDAARVVCDRNPNVRFVLAGAGPTLADITRLASLLPEGKVTVIPAIPKSDTRSFYLNCDIVLVPLAALKMFEETVPSKLFEILACEVPLIASVAGEAAEILASAGVGCVVPPGDAISLSVAILRELAKPRESRARAGAGRRFVEESFSRTALADRYLHLLSTVVGLSSGHSSSRQ